MEEDVKKYWMERYQEDKIGTIAKLSQAMQHMAWLREWQRVHGDEKRIKPITKKVDGEKVKIGEANIAVPWSNLNEFFRNGNEYGDIETVKFLIDKIQSGDIQELTEQELHDLSEKENVKWSDGKHSLNPFKGYLYDFTGKNPFILEPTSEEDYGKFYPMRDYEGIGKPKSLETDDERYNEANKSFSRFYTTRLMQTLLDVREDSKYYDFVNFDITSVTTPEQIEELDKKLAEIVQSPEIQESMKALENNSGFEKHFYDQLRKEVEIEIKKDSDRIENAHKVFVALETGNLDEILEDKETRKWAHEFAREEIQKKENESKEKSFHELLNICLTSNDPALDEMCWIKTTENYSDSKPEHKVQSSVDEPITIREAILCKLIERPHTMSFYHSYGQQYSYYDQYSCQIIPFDKCTEEQKKIMKKKYLLRQLDRQNNDVQDTKDEVKRKIRRNWLLCCK